MKIACLCGGVGGSKLVLGLYHEFPNDDLSIIVNTGDDLTQLGLHVSPDLDTVMYTLAGVANPTTGWGLESDTFNGLAMLDCYGHDTWFKLGDRDIATHVVRTHLLAQGRSLTEATALLSSRLNVAAHIHPMTDDRVATQVRIDSGWLSFQEYFVKRRHADTPLEVKHDGISHARLPASVRRAIEGADVVVVAPSNPVVSIGPILAIPGLRECLIQAPARKVAVSPFIGNQSIAGPASALMQAIRFEPTSAGLASLYSSWLDVLVIDKSDSSLTGAIEANGIRTLTTDTLMPTLAEKRTLARFAIEGTR